MISAGDKQEGPKGSGEAGKRDDFFPGHGLHRKPRLAPAGETAGNDISLDSDFIQFARHTGAGGVAQSSAVEEDVLIQRKILKGITESVRIEAAGALNADGVLIVISVTSDVINSGGVRGKPGSGRGRSENRRRYELLLLPHDADAIGNPENESGDNYSFDEAARGMEATFDGFHRITEKKADHRPRADVEKRAARVEDEEMQPGHGHAAGQRRGHGVDAGNELGKKENNAPTAMESAG